MLFLKSAHRGAFPPAALLVLLASCQSAPTPQSPSPAPATAPADGPPEIVSLAPAEGTGRGARFEVTASHPGGADKIESVQLLIDRSISGSDACWLDFRAASGTVALRSDDGTSWLPAIVAGQPGVVENRQCAVAAINVIRSAEGNTLKVVFPAVFKETMRGGRNVYAIASGPSAHSGWSEKGHWNIP